MRWVGNIVHMREKKDVDRALAGYVFKCPLETIRNK
jgi:hypothetical protein